MVELVLSDDDSKDNQFFKVQLQDIVSPTDLNEVNLNVTAQQKPGTSNVQKTQSQPTINEMGIEDYSP